MSIVDACTVSSKAAAWDLQHTHAYEGRSHTRTVGCDSRSLTPQNEASYWRHWVGLTCTRCLTAMTRLHCMTDRPDFFFCCMTPTTFTGFCTSQRRAELLSFLPFSFSVLPSLLSFLSSLCLCFIFHSLPLSRFHLAAVFSDGSLLFPLKRQSLIHSCNCQQKHRCQSTANAPLLLAVMVSVQITE